MIRFDCECKCGRSFSMFVEQGSSVKCPYCGKLVAVPDKENVTTGKYEAKSLEDATSDIMSEGGFAPSGAR